MDKSPCCEAKIDGQLADGILCGSCAKCGKIVVRINPKTGKEEELTNVHINNPWYDIDNDPENIEKLNNEQFNKFTEELKKKNEHR